MSPLKSYLSILAATFAFLSCSTAATNDTIHSAAELMQVISRNDANGRTFSIRGTAYAGAITQRSGFFVFQNGKGAYLYDIRPEYIPAIKPNDIIIATGVIEPRSKPSLSEGLNANCTNVTILGKAAPIHHIPISADDIEQSCLLYKPIRITGTLIDIRTDEIDPRHTLLVIDCSNRTVNAASKIPYNDIRTQIGAQVEIKGVLSRHHSRRIHGRKIIMIARPDAIRILKPPSDEWFRAPEIGNTDELSPEVIVALGRRKIIGHVLTVWNGDTMLVRSTSNRLVKINLVVSPPQVGEDIESVGYAGTDLFHVNLSRGIWRPASPTHKMPEAIECVSAHSLLTDSTGERKFNIHYHGKTIKLRGAVRTLPSGDSGGRLALDSDGYTVMLNCNFVPSAVEHIEIGTTVSVVGVCVMETENWNRHAILPRTHGMFISVNSTDNIKIIATPPWWTPARLIAVICALILFIVAILAWNFSLRRLSERRGRELFRNQIVRAESELRIDERTRIAAELHDHLAQNLTAIAYQLASADRSRVSAPEASSGHLATAVKMLGSCRTELRRCLWDLKSDALNEPDIAVAIRKSIEPVCADAAIEVVFPVPRSKLSDSTVHAILSISRELAANAVNHGKSDLIRVKGYISDGILSFTVIDNGSGFDPFSAPDTTDGHFGLDGIRERLRKHNGSMSVESSPGNGCRITINMTSGKIRC